MNKLAWILVALLLIAGTVVIGCPSGNDNNSGDGGGNNTGNGTASFTVSNLTIHPEEANPRDVITITIMVTNSGTASGSYDAVLTVNGNAEDSETVSLSAGGSANISFEVAKSDPGSYQIDIAGLSGLFEVSEDVSGEGIAAAAVEANHQINSCSFASNIEITTSDAFSGTQITSMGTNGVMDIANKEMWFDMQISMPDFGSMTLTSDVYFTDGWLYMGVEIPGFGSQWVKSEIPEDQMDMMWSEYDIAGRQYDLLVDILDAETLGSDTINGIDCYKLLVTPDPTKLLEWSLAQQGIDPGSYPYSKDVITDFSFINWIAKDSFYTIKTDMDMTMFADGVTTSFTMSFSISDINETVYIKLPPEALSAEEVPYNQIDGAQDT